MRMPAKPYRPASDIISEGLTSNAWAIRNRFKAVTFLSPRSILPIWDLSISAICASASCEVPSLRRTARIALPRATNWRTSSSVRNLHDTAAPSQAVHQRATGYTTQICLMSVTASRILQRAGGKISICLTLLPPGLRRCLKSKGRQECTFTPGSFSARCWWL